MTKLSDLTKATLEKVKPTPDQIALGKQVVASGAQRIQAVATYDNLQKAQKQTSQFIQDHKPSE